MDRRNIMSTLVKTRKRVTWDKFCDIFKNYILKNCRHAEDFVCIATDIEAPATSLEEIHMPGDLTQ